MSCETCRHAEMCRWVDEVGARGCDFEDSATTGEGDLIRRQDAIRTVQDMHFKTAGQTARTVNRLKRLPSADEATGHWITKGRLHPKCDKCGWEYGSYVTNYCPNCGIKMERGSEYMTVILSSYQIEKCKEKMCDEYCRMPRELDTDLDEECEKCPLNLLSEENDEV